ncbi:acyl-CoA dehydrogenase [Sphingobium lactosutens]|uniref:acyl-CoA dehydrogenase family protein n=1 Tax=Sphingobium lactosutens TaxID=522773 RepID=UPI0015BB68BC|nr:acyl-CoA dehydrogenase family protein [Sphingobium lactosutens]NWK96044.1 acyl-CoA dehydrogenase [Sphingobium lactosutens]
MTDSPFHANASDFTDEDLAIYRDSIARFLDEHASAERNEKWRRDKVVERSVWHDAGRFGMLGASVPAQYGGLGGDFRHERIIIEEFGKRGLEGWGVPLHNMIVAPYIAAFGTEAQKAQWLPRVASGETILAIAMSEPGTGSDLQGIRTHARREGDDYIINGQKTFISNGQTADLILVVCKTDKEAGSRGISLIAVEGERAGFRRGRNLDKMGREAQDTSELFFEDVRVPADNLLGGIEGKGFAQLMTMLPQERLGIAAMGLAIMERAIALAVDYARDRTAFGKTLMDFQNTQFVLAEAKTKAVIARSFIDSCVDKLLVGTLDATTASMAKLWITETELETVSRCLQLFGGYGYMNEYPISQLYRDARIDTIHGGTSEIMKLLIARSL